MREIFTSEEDRKVTGNIQALQMFSKENNTILADKMKALEIVPDSESRWVIDNMQTLEQLTIQNIQALETLLKLILKAFRHRGVKPTTHHRMESERSYPRLSRSQLGAYRSVRFKEI